jgi:hypothetical protein
MKVCPKCNQTYTDDGLNFCLADGELLMDPSTESPTQIFNDPSPPTIFMDSPRRTNPNHSAWEAAPPPQPMAQWQNQQMNQPYRAPDFAASRDQTLPVIALIAGVLSLVLVCCYGGIWLGVPAAILGYMGMTKADSDPDRFTGRGMAIAGLALGSISFLLSMIFVIIQLFAR